MLEIEHNPHALIAHERIYVSNPLRCEYAIRDFMKQKQPLGLRCRHTYDIKGGYIELSARWSQPLRTVRRYLQDCGLLRNSRKGN